MNWFMWYIGSESFYVILFGQRSLCIMSGLFIMYSAIVIIYYVCRVLLCDYYGRHIVIMIIHVFKRVIGEIVLQ